MTYVHITVFLTFVTRIWNVAYCEKCLYSDVLTWSPTLNLGSFSLFYLPEPIWVLSYILKGFILIVLWLHLLTIPSNLSIYTFFDIDVMNIFVNFVLKSSNKFSSNNRFFFAMCWITLCNCLKWLFVQDYWLNKVTFLLKSSVLAQIHKNQSKLLIKLVAIKLGM